MIYKLTDYAFILKVSLQRNERLPLTRKDMVKVRRISTCRLVA